MKSADSPPPVTAFALVLGLFLVLMGATWFRHTDVGDAQLYQVIARQMLRSGDWLSMEYLGNPFFDHLPFGLWPIVAAQALDERALIPLHAIFSLLTVALVGWSAHRLGGPWAGLGAMFFLATTQMYFFQTSYPTLDPLLLLLTTASVLPMLTGAGTRGQWLIAWLSCALAVAVKGPFGLLPLGGALGARVLVDRSRRHLAWGGAVFLLAIAPTGLFLALRPDWLSGYGVGQLLASATGERSDGGAGFGLALRFIGDRFWPWFPLLFVGLAAATGRPSGLVTWLAPPNPEELTLFVQRCRLAATACALVLLGLSLPHRKIWHHTLVAYPLLCILIGLALGPRLARWCGGRKKGLLTGLGAMVALAVFGVAGGVDRLLMAPPCVLATDFSKELERLRAGQVVPVISERDEWDMLSALAFEHDVLPQRRANWDGVVAPVALVSAKSWLSAPPGWRALKQARGWVFAIRLELSTSWPRPSSTQALRNLLELACPTLPLHGEMGGVGVGLAVPLRV